MFISYLTALKYSAVFDILTHRAGAVVVKRKIYKIIEHK